MYRNNRDGTFTDVTASSGLAGLGWAADACVFDFDGDGWPDVAVTNMFGRAQLYKNQGNETFADVTLKVLGPTSWGGMGVHPFDFNNDGKLDLFIADMHSDMWIPYDYDLATIDDKKRNKILGVPVHPDHPLYSQLVEKNRPFADLVSMRPAEVVYGNVFFKNLGQGKFQEISPSANLETFWPWGIACGDWDNDGFEDVFIPSGMGHPFAYWPNSLLMNQGNETFAERADRFGLEPPHKGYFLEEAIGGRFAPRSSRAAAVADFNKDGRLDIIVNNFNDHPYYYKNVGTKGNFVALRLQGTKSNRDAIGAVVRLYTGKDVMTRQVNPACGYLAQSSKTVHFGLGDRTKIDRITVTWPSGMEQELPALALDKLHTIQEP